MGDRFHLVDTTVAGDTADSPRHVHVVGEISVVGKFVDANPAHRPVVLGAVQNGDARAYPAFMMAYHHIVNDVLGGFPYLVTY